MTNWIELFDGKTYDGWRGYNRPDMPSAWTIDDGTIKINSQANRIGGFDHGDGGDIIYHHRRFSNFELYFEWKVAQAGNSGVFYLSNEIAGEPSWKGALEYQILDNEHHPDSFLGVDGNRKSASLYDLVPANPQNSKPFGDWNTGEIIVNNGKVTHRQNGEDVLHYTLWTEEWEACVANSKFNAIESFVHVGGSDRSGHIILQDHRDDVWFRNIRIRDLND